jgi:hypothetical protein
MEEIEIKTKQKLYTNGSDVDICEQLESISHLKRSAVAFVAKICTITLAGIHLIKELFQFFQVKR